MAFKYTKRKSILFSLSDYIGDADRFHFSKNYLSNKTTLAYHHHDYYELFWVTDGTGSHFINDKEVKISAGDMVFIRPKDSHTFHLSERGQNLVLYNLALLKEDVDHFQNRYITNEDNFIWRKGHMPVSKQLSKDQLQHLTFACQEFLNTKRGSVELDSILLSILRLLIYPIRNIKIPSWLEQAVFRFSGQLVLPKGSESFLKYCNRSHAHVNRTIRSNYGESLTQFLNGIRLHHAQDQLRSGGKGIKTIAHTVGLHDVAYFHKLFKKRFGITPNGFRESIRKPF